MTTMMKTTKDFSTMGVPTKLLRKQILVEAIDEPERLPVYTLTFELPPPFPNDDDDDDGDDEVVSDQMKKMLITKPHSDICVELGDVVKMIIPQYKPKSYSVSDLRIGDKEFDVTLKVYPNGRASGYLDRLKVGDTIRSFGKSANRYRNHHHHHHHHHLRNNNNHNDGDANDEKEEEKNDDHHSRNEHICIIVYGVGITEGLPVARKELERIVAERKQRHDDDNSNNNNNNNSRENGPDQSTVTLLWASRTMGDTFWHNQIKELEDTYNGGKDTTTATTTKLFELVHILSRECDDSDVDCYRGRINPTVLKKVFQLQDQTTSTNANTNNENENDRYSSSSTSTTATATTTKPLFLSVGTKDMMKMTYDLLSNMGYPSPEYQLIPKKVK